MPEENDPGHGNSPAAWTAVIIMLVGFAVGTTAFFLDVPIVVWASVGVIVLGAIIGLVMSRMGYGVRGPRYIPRSHD